VGLQYLTELRGHSCSFGLVLGAATGKMPAVALQALPRDPKPKGSPGRIRFFSGHQDQRPMNLQSGEVPRVASVCRLLIRPSPQEFNRHWNEILALPLYSVKEGKCL
jgi:hypothetical protein